MQAIILVIIVLIVMILTLSTWTSKKSEEDRQSKIDAVTAIYNSLNVRECCVRRIKELYSEAMEQIDAVRVAPERIACLKKYATGLVNRQL